MYPSIAQTIANGHAFEKHGHEFGISDPSQLALIIEDIMNNPSDSKNLSGGRVAYWDSVRHAVLITNPNHSDGGMIFKPHHDKPYYDNLR